MEDDEDDLYGENGTTSEPQPEKEEDAPDVRDSDEEEDMDEADSDSDVEIVTERPGGDDALAQPGNADTAQRSEAAPRASAAIPIIAPSQQSQAQAPLVAVPGSTQANPVLTLESGLGFPGVHSSTVDVNGNPIYAPAGKPITQVEIDVDLIEHEKPWRRPGADQSDWFNYGFDEFSWSTYCMRQKTMGDTIVEQRAENAQFESMFGGGAGAGGAGAAGVVVPPPGMMPGMPPVPPAGMNPMAGMMGGGMPPGAMGMPNEQEFQVAMMEAMRQQGVSDPSQVDFNAFMAQLQGGGGMKQQQQQPQQQQQGMGGGQQAYDQGNWQVGGGAGGNNFQGGNRGGYGRGKRGQRY